MNLILQKETVETNETKLNCIQKETVETNRSKSKLVYKRNETSYLDGGLAEPPDVFWLFACCRFEVEVGGSPPQIGGVGFEKGGEGPSDGC